MDHPLSTDVVTDGLTPHEVTLSPNGRHLAYTLAPLAQTTPRPVNTLWVTGIDGTAPRPLTDGTFAVHRPRWSPDDRLYFLTDRTDCLAGRTHQSPLAPGLHRIEADGTGHRSLTDPRTTVVDHLPLPDKTTVALVVADPEPPDDAPREWGRHQPHHRLALLDLPSGATRTITGLGEHHVLHIAARPDGAHLAVITHP
ncbi:PD40 domain-containing protein [Nocardiopsis sp. JB363]|uniref:TolB family protein n=1 Tax=Nocardiopsis sp. JB363 TaxID=1434837 RepID=UPI00097AA346|nr:PD40 domain-containing protein [Nocardiopsis sp. JB363]SIO90594.1 Dipeptidyl aminopeptidase/acylaminoacyl-peptidase-like [Nocardiopsis sp. JB363]